MPMESHIIWKPSFMRLRATFTVRLSGPVDGSALQRAADRALERYPQMAVGVARDKTITFSFRSTCLRPYLKATGSVVRHMGTEDTSAYLFCISHEGKHHPCRLVPRVCRRPWFYRIFEKHTILLYMKETGLPLKNDGSIRDESLRPLKRKRPRMRF